MKYNLPLPGGPLRSGVLRAMKLPIRSFIPWFRRSALPGLVIPLLRAFLQLWSLLGMISYLCLNKKMGAREDEKVRTRLQIEEGPTSRIPCKSLDQARRTRGCDT